MPPLQTLYAKIMNSNDKKESTLLGDKGRKSPRLSPEVEALYSDSFHGAFFTRQVASNLLKRNNAARSSFSTSTTPAIVDRAVLVDIPSITTPPPPVSKSELAMMNARWDAMSPLPISHTVSLNDLANARGGSNPSVQITPAMSESGSSDALVDIDNELEQDVCSFSPVNSYRS